MQHPVENEIHGEKLTPLLAWPFVPYHLCMIDDSYASLHRVSGSPPCGQVGHPALSLASSWELNIAPSPPSNGLKIPK